MKKFSVIFLSIVCVFSLVLGFNAKANATKSEINVENVVEEKKVDNSIATEIMLMNYITTKTEEIIRTKNRIILDDVIDMIDNGLALTKTDERTQSYFIDLRNSIKDLVLEERKRNRIQYMFKQKEAKAMQEALSPNIATSLLTAVAGKALKENPVSAVLSIGAIVLDRVSAYNNSIAESEDQNLKDGWELDDTALTNVFTLKTNLLKYREEMVRNYSIPEEMILYKDQVEEYEKRRVDDNHTARINFYENNIDSYKGFPLVHLELAKSYYSKQEYKKCVDSIDKYLNSEVDIFRCDKDLARVLPIGFAAALNYMSNSEYEKYANRLLDIYKDIFKNDISNTLSELKFKYVVINMDLYNKTNNKKYLDEAYKQCFNNIEPLVKEQKEEMKNDEMAINENLILNLESFFAIADKKGISNKEREDINKILFGENEYEPLFDCILLNKHYYYGNYDEVGDNVDDYKYREPYVIIDEGKIALIINHYFVTKDSDITVQINDDDRTTTVYLNYSSGNYFPAFESYDINKNLFDKNVKLKINIVPKSGIDLEELNYEIDCVKMPFGSESVKVINDFDNFSKIVGVYNPLFSFALGKVTKGKNNYEEIKEMYMALGFSEDNIYLMENKDFLSKGSGKVKRIVYSYSKECAFDEKGKIINGNYKDFSENDLISNNHSISILYK